jgi:TPP-dependent pyruvate/acetoin dehydrogenase alpha subunit
MKLKNMDNLDNLIKQRFYSQMAMIRQTEQALLDLFAEGRIRGTVHTCLGQEATATGVVAALDPELDIICSNHRGHGHFLAFTGNVYGLIAEIAGLTSGICNGIGGSQHLYSKNFYSNGILGGMPPIACGMAVAEKINKTGAIVTVFLGDGAMAEGNLYETMNLAAIFGAPILFAVEQNQYAQSTSTHHQHGGCLTDRAPSFGVPLTEVDGNDVMAVFTASKTIVAKMRVNPGPHMLFMNTYRLGPHSKGDDLRDIEEIQKHWDNCPLQRLGSQLDHQWTQETLHQTRQSISEIVNSIKEKQ